MNKALFSLVLSVVILSACNKQVDPPVPVIPPRINVKDYGAKGDGRTDDNTAIAAAITAGHDKKLPVYFPAGKYVARIVISDDSVTLTGEKGVGRFFDSAGTVILGLINCNFKKKITVSNMGIDSRGLLLASDDAALTSGVGAGNQPLDQTFTNVALLGGGFNDYKHGILCQAGSGIHMSNIYVSSFFHGIAIRCSDVSVDGVSADYCGFTSIVVKSAEILNELVQNVTVKNVRINGDPSDAYRRGGVVMVMSYNSVSLTQNVTVDSVRSINGGVGAVIVEQDAGVVKNVSVANCYAEGSGDSNIRAAYDVIGGSDITFTNCNSVKSNGLGFRSAGNPVNLVVRSSSESNSAAGAWSGSFKYLQLNGVEIIK